MLTKHTAWGYEREWRVILEPHGDQLVPLAQGAIREIYVGSQMNDGPREVLRSVLAGKNIEQYLVMLSPLAFKLERVRIKDG